ncbi:MAG: hypothetical protein ACRCVW_01025 [Brevinema sp.]
MKNYRFLFFLFLLSLTSVTLLFAQTLDQQMRQAIQEGVIPTNFTTPNLSNINTLNRFFDQAPEGISSLISVPELVEEVKMGLVTTYFPQGYGRNQLHYGIWNAIPFVIFNNTSLEVRFGLIFEHRQIGFIPDDWISTTISAAGLPEISFLIPPTKTFLNYANGTSQWRATVLLTEDQITNLKRYAETAATPNPNDPYQDTFNATHRFIDSSTRDYLLGTRNKNYLKILLQVYDYIKENPLVKTFQQQDKFPKSGFFDEILQDTNTILPSVPTNAPSPTTATSPVDASIKEGTEETVAPELEITESMITEEITTESDEDSYAEEAYIEEAYPEEGYPEDTYETE